MSFSIDDDPAAGAARLTLALYQPDIPQNAGTMLRACACLGVGAAIIEPAGFPVSDRHFRRSGMDYLDHVEITRHMSFATFEDWRAGAGRRLVLLTTTGATPYTDFAFRHGDVLMVGRESAGALEALRQRSRGHARRVEGLEVENEALASAVEELRGGAAEVVAAARRAAGV